MLTVLLAITFATLPSFGYTAGPTVTTAYGVLEGKVVNTQKGDCDAYLGVPFAKAPVGDLRWQKPQPPEAWKDTRNASEFGPRCIQIGSTGTNPEQESEDCLHLNIFVPKSALPVMVFIHGGAFFFGTAEVYGQEGICENLASRGVIVITIQYRLFMYGFFSTGDETALGNYGLWDQLEALKWVKDNIASFRGDPDKVTVFGESAGAASVSLLTYTTASKDLFQQSLAQSGSAFSFWAALSDVSVATGKQLAQAAKCTDPKPAAYVKCLRQLSTADLQAVYNGMTITTNSYDTWSMRVDGELYNQSIPKELDTKRPAIIGVNTMETPIPSVTDIPSAYSILNWTLSWAINENDTTLNDVLTQTALYVYLDSKGDRNDPQFVYEEAIKMQVDLGFHAPAAHESTLKMAADSPIWVYNFDYWSDNVFPSDYPFQKGAPHAHELCYLFLLPLTPEIQQSDLFCPDKYEGKYRQIADYLGEMWTNFAITGDPSPKGLTWPKFNSITNASTMTIRENLSIEHKYYLDVTNFWYSLKPSIESDFANMVKNDTHPTGGGASSRKGITCVFGIALASILMKIAF